MDLNDTPDQAAFRTRVQSWLQEHKADAPPASGDSGDTAYIDSRRAWQDRLAEAGYAGLTWPKEFGGQGLGPIEQVITNQELATARVPGILDVIGIGMLGPCLIAHGSDEQKGRYLGPMLHGDEVWCQLFSEPAAGSDLAAVQTRAVENPDGSFSLTGQKVWTTNAQFSSYGLLLARTSPDKHKHKGLTMFIVPMDGEGVTIRGLRQISGEAEFNEVFFTDVRVPDSARLGEEGHGWAVAQGTLMNERMAIGGSAARESGMVGKLAALWRERPDLRRPALHDRLMRLWVEAEAYRMASERQRQQLLAGRPGPDGSGSKVTYAQLNQDSTALELEVLAAEGLRHDDWSLRRPTESNWLAGGATHRYLRTKGNSIEGGTSEILLNVIAERVLGLPREPRTDGGASGKDLRR